MFADPGRNLENPHCQKYTHKQRNQTGNDSRFHLRVTRGNGVGVFSKIRTTLSALLLFVTFSFILLAAHKTGFEKNLTWEKPRFNLVQFKDTCVSDINQ